MRHYRQNTKWLIAFAPFRTLAISAAYVTPFLQLHGLGLTQVFVLQAIFSVALLLWEVPSGYLADRFGRAFCIKLNAPIAAVAMVLYGLSTQYWQFVLCELGLALASGLVNGIDSALLYDSLAADGRAKKEFAKLSQRMQLTGFISLVVGSLLGIALVALFGISSTVIADGVLTGIGSICAFKLVEAPRSCEKQTKSISAWQTAKQLGQNAEVRWLITLGATLNTTTYLAAWLAAPYYASLGIPAAAFSGILAGRSAIKAVISHKVSPTKHLEHKMFSYVILAGGVYLGMATGQLWLIWVVLGHDTIHALQVSAINARLNTHIADEFRATMNSTVSLIQRLVYSLAGPLVGLLVDHIGLGHGLSVTGLCCSCVAFIAFARLRRLKTFQEGN